MKFKVGDTVKVTFNDNGTKLYVGEVAKITSIRPPTISPTAKKYPYTLSGFGSTAWFGEHEITLVRSVDMGRRAFKLLKETPDIKKGAIFEEACDDGTQEYVLLDKTFLRYPEQYNRNFGSGSHPQYDRDSVEKEPKFFVEVFKVAPKYFTAEEMTAYQLFLKGQGKQAVKKAVGRPKAIPARVTRRKYTRRAK